MKKLSGLFLVMISLIIVSGILNVCVGCTRRNAMGDDVNQNKIRQIQSRYYNTIDSERTINAIIVTLEDFGFSIDTSSVVLGIVSGTKPTNRQFKMKVFVTEREGTQQVIRADAKYNNHAMFDTAFYEKFFTLLSRNLRLKAYPFR